jgi:hypothetical protein
MIEIQLYRDGGTLSISHSGVAFCIDKRIATVTKYQLYLGHPSHNRPVTEESDFNKFSTMLAKAIAEDQITNEQRYMIERAVEMYDEYKKKSEINEIYEKFYNGDSFTDEEVDQGISFFTDITKMLDCLGKEFRLQGNETRRIRDSLISYREARERSRFRAGELLNSMSINKKKSSKICDEDIDEID